MLSNAEIDHHTTIKFTSLKPEARPPTRATKQSAGLDLYSTEELIIKPQETKTIHTGISMQLPIFHFGQICDRSSIAISNVKVLGGIIDSDYMGEIKVLLHNLSPTVDFKVEKDMKVAQMIITPFLSANLEHIDMNDRPATERGQFGFGSSGLHYKPVGK